MSQVPVRDPAFMEAINKNMRVPERLSVGTGWQWLEEEGEQPMDPPPAYTMQSPIRRSYSDQSFGRTPPGTPTQLKQALALPRHPSNSRGSDRPLHQYSAASLSAQTTSPQAQAQPFPATPFSLLSPQSMLQTAKQLGLQAFQHLLQTVSHKYRAMENWSLEEEGGAAVEFIVLRRQVMKMSRRLAALERHNTERRNTEVVLFSLLFSACLLNMWLWIRR
eukprot:superscaffoldBa00000700_g6656